MLSMYLFSMFLPLLGPLLYSNFRLMKYPSSISKKKKSLFVYLGLFHKFDGKRQLGVNTNLGSLL